MIRKNLFTVGSSSFLQKNYATRQCAPAKGILEGINGYCVLVFTSGMPAVDVTKTVLELITLLHSWN